MRVETSRIATLKTKQQTAVLDEDIFELWAHMHGWAYAELPMPVTTVKYETLSDPAVAKVLEERLCLTEPFELPAPTAHLGGGANNNHAGMHRAEIIGQPRF